MPVIHAWITAIKKTKSAFWRCENAGRRTNAGANEAHRCGGGGASPPTQRFSTLPELIWFRCWSRLWPTALESPRAARDATVRHHDNKNNRRRAGLDLHDNVFVVTHRSRFSVKPRASLQHLKENFAFQPTSEQLVSPDRDAV